MKNAQMAETAVVIIAGAAPILSKNRGALQVVTNHSKFRKTSAQEDFPNGFGRPSRI